MNKIPPYNSKCPLCNNPCAYEGIFEVQCPNEHCSNFVQKQKELLRQWEDEVIEEQKNRAAYSGDDEYTKEDEEDEYGETSASLRRIMNHYGSFKTTAGGHNVYIDPSDTQTDNNIDDDDDEYDTVY